MHRAAMKWTRGGKRLPLWGVGQWHVNRRFGMERVSAETNTPRGCRARDAAIGSGVDASAAAGLPGLVGVTHACGAELHRLRMPALRGGRPSLDELDPHFEFDARSRGDDGA
jgi:hypothetical protein